MPPTPPKNPPHQATLQQTTLQHAPSPVQLVPAETPPTATPPAPPTAAQIASVQLPPAAKKRRPRPLSDLLKQRLENLPDKPGVYLHKDRHDRVLYVGKASSLRQRVRSYFQSGSDHLPHIRAMVLHVYDINILETRTEMEALLLEANLIKKYSPRYNIKYKDDKSYPFFKLTSSEKYPRLFLTREAFHPNAEYFGPYASVKDARETLRLIRRHFQLRSSKMNLDGNKVHRPCLNFHLRRCLAPCRGDVPVEQYAQVVQQVRLFFQGKSTELLARLRSEMTAYAEQQAFEKAAQKRDTIAAIERTVSTQVALIPNSEADWDVAAFHTEKVGNKRYAGIQMLFVRRGRLMGSDFIWLEDGMAGLEAVSDDAQPLPQQDEHLSEKLACERILRGALTRFYTTSEVHLPQSILIPQPFEDMVLLSESLTEKKKQRVNIHVVQRGAKRRWIALAEQNALRHFKEHLLALNTSSSNQSPQLLQDIQLALRLKHLPSRVEGFDISTLQGTATVASMVSWLDNQADKNAYRKYNIRIALTKGQDDFAAMYEVVQRRYERLLKSDQPLPDLILIDGGKGQVSAALRALTTLGINVPNDVDVIGLAKGRSEKRRAASSNTLPPITKTLDEEYVVKAHSKLPLRLPSHAPALKFLQRIRDESHRFALSHHRHTRKKASFQSVLDSVPGIGAKRKQDLLNHFGSVSRLTQASLEDLTQAPGISATLAHTLHQLFNTKDSLVTKTEQPTE